MTPQATVTARQRRRMLGALGICLVAVTAALTRTSASQGAVQPGAPSDVPPDVYYTQDQAVRGKALFNRNCALCHVASPTSVPRTSLPPTRGYWQGSSRNILNLGGTYVRKYPSVYHIFRRIRDSMPPWNPDSVGTEAKVDIVAYLLEANGIPPGGRALSLDVGAMKMMTLNEPGFVKVFNGKDFAGIKFMLGMNCKPAPLGCGSTEPGSVFWVDTVNRELVTSGKIAGYWYPDKKFLNFTMRFDFRFERPADLDPDDDYYDGNSGYLLFITEHQVWPRMIEVQGNNINVLSVGGGGGKSTLDREARDRVKKPVGQWNSVEISNHNGEIRNSLNGTFVSGVTGHTFTEPGYIGFQSEGVPVHWRNIRIKAD